MTWGLLCATNLLSSKLKGIILKCFSRLWNGPGLSPVTCQPLWVPLGSPALLPILTKHPSATCLRRKLRSPLAQARWATQRRPAANLGGQRVSPTTAEPHTVTPSGEARTSAPRGQAPHISHCSFSLMKCSAQRRVSSRYRLGW